MFAQLKIRGAKKVIKRAARTFYHIITKIGIITVIKVKFKTL